MSYPIDLSITGKPSPRTKHPASAGKQRTPMTANKTRNQSSNIFGSLDNEQLEPRNVAKKNHSQASHGIVTKSKLEEIKNLSNRNADEEKRDFDMAAYRSPCKLAPAGVPKLSLDDDTEDMSYSKVAPGPPKIYSPGPKDTFSWGTPLHQQHHPVQKPTKGGGWQVNQARKPSKSASASTRRKHDDVPYLDLKLSQSNEALGKLRQAAKEVREDLQIEYLGTSKLTQNNAKNCKSKKQDFIEEAILQDQAMRLKLNEERPSSSVATPSFGLHKPFDSRSKRHEELFNTRSMVTGVQDDLSKRLRFSARILSLNGHDAQRELNGFFFVSDDTLTMYEFRQFGTRANALPFIQRGIYSHVTGHRKDQPYCILDVTTGKNLTFHTANQPSLPDRLKQKQTITFRIISTDDEEARKKLLYNGCKTSKQKQEVDKFIQQYEKEESNPAYAALCKIQGNIRKSFESRGTKTITTLFHHFKTIDKSGDGLLSKEEIQTALQKFRIKVSDQEFELIWKLVDTNNDGGLDYGEFVRGFFGEMNEARKTWVRKAFTRLDPSNSGIGDGDNLYKFFCASKHPCVISGEMTEASFFEYLQDIFQITNRRKEIPYKIFEAYYEGVSIPMKSDENFITLLKTTWTF